jgi:hypothetical protein
MVQAIGSASSAGVPGAGGSSGALEAQLNRYQIQLADWCNCPSGKTPEGKAKIQQIQAKADAVQAQLDRIEAAKTRQPSTSNPVIAPPAAQSATLPTSLGGFLDVFA